MDVADGWLWGCSPFRVTEDDHELTALRKVLDAANKVRKGKGQAAAAQPVSTGQENASQQLAKQASGLSDVPTFSQLNASLRRAAELLCRLLGVLAQNALPAMPCSSSRPCEGCRPAQAGAANERRARVCRRLQCARRPQHSSSQVAIPAWQGQREDMRALLAQKRNIFLVMMAMDTKRDEIAKLRAHASQRGQALTKGEQMLSEDTAKFDAFLKDNDEKLRQAMQEADSEVRAKQEKVSAQIIMGASCAARRVQPAVPSK